MMPIHAVSTSGVNRHIAKGVAMKARDIAERFPDDPHVQVQLAEAEFDNDALDRADAAADRALALKPDFVEALVYKGMIAVRRAKESESKDAGVWSAARGWYLKANRAEPNDARPLYLYYLSFRQAKAKPGAAAVTALSRAHVLSPESEGVRALLARQMLDQDDTASARFLLQPLAFQPHRRTQKNVAREVIALIDAGKLAEAKAAMDGEQEED